MKSLSLMAATTTPLTTKVMGLKPRSGAVTALLAARPGKSADTQQALGLVRPVVHLAAEADAVSGVQACGIKLVGLRVGLGTEVEMELPGSLQVVFVAIPWAFLVSHC